MKARKKIILSIIGAALALTPVVIFTYNYIATADERHLLKRIAVESRSAGFYESILDSFAAEGGGFSYHDSYAGAYLDEKGKLIVMLAAFGKEDFDSGVSYMLAASGAGSADDISFMEAEYTYTFLLDLLDRLYALFLEKNADPESIWSSVTGLSLLDEQNRIYVDILELDNEKAGRFLSETSEPGAIGFAHGEKLNMSEKSEESYDFHAGQRVNNGSIGFRARMDSITGFVTAGHITQAGATVRQGEPIGTCISSISDSTLDAAFVRAGDICVMSNRTYKGHVIARINATPLAGATVFKLGRSSGLTRGRITSVNAAYLYTLFNGHVKIIRTNIITADYPSKAGDSGGIVFDAQNRLLGIHIAGPSHGKAGNRAVEKVSTIQDVLKVSFY